MCVKIIECVRVGVYLHVHMKVSVFICMCAGMHVCMFVYTYTYVSLCTTHVCVHMPRLDFSPGSLLRAHSYVHIRSRGRPASGIDGAPGPQTDPVPARFLVGEAGNI